MVSHLEFNLTITRDQIKSIKKCTYSQMLVVL